MIDATERIDSRDVIERLEELQGERDDLSEALDESGLRLDELLADPTQLHTTPEWKRAHAEAKAARDAAKAALKAWDDENAEEMAALRDLDENCEGYGDWQHGETLIREDQFVVYIEELIHECYELPKEVTSGAWPWRHMKIDYEAAADEARADYDEVEYLGRTYLIRC